MSDLKKRVEREVKPRSRGGGPLFWSILVILVLVLALLAAGLFYYFSTRS